VISLKLDNVLVSLQNLHIKNQAHRISYIQSRQQKLLNQMQEFQSTKNEQHTPLI
jgi:hypothetical protein